MKIIIFPGNSVNSTSSINSLNRCLGGKNSRSLHQVPKFTFLDKPKPRNNSETNPPYHSEGVT